MDFENILWKLNLGCVIYISLLKTCSLFPQNLGCVLNTSASYTRDGTVNFYICKFSCHSKKWECFSWPCSILSFAYCWRVTSRLIIERGKADNQLKLSHTLIFPIVQFVYRSTKKTPICFIYLVCRQKQLQLDRGHLSLVEHCRFFVSCFPKEVFTKNSKKSWNDEVWSTLRQTNPWDHPWAIRRPCTCCSFLCKF